METSTRLGSNRGNDVTIVADGSHLAVEFANTGGSKSVSVLHASSVSACQE